MTLFDYATALEAYSGKRFGVIATWALASILTIIYGAFREKFPWRFIGILLSLEMAAMIGYMISLSPEREHLHQQKEQSVNYISEEMAERYDMELKPEHTEGFLKQLNYSAPTVDTFYYFTDTEDGTTTDYRLVFDLDDKKLTLQEGLGDDLYVPVPEQKQS